MRNVYLFRRPRRRHVKLRWTATYFLLAALLVIFAPSTAVSTFDERSARHASLATHDVVRFSLPSTIADVGCTDLQAQTEAQFFITPQNSDSPQRLIRDDDRVTCEWLP
jgi:hypothetical protein